MREGQGSGGADDREGKGAEELMTGRGGAPHPSASAICRPRDATRCWSRLFSLIFLSSSSCVLALPSCSLRERGNGVGGSGEGGIRCGSSLFVERITAAAAPFPFRTRTLSR